MEYFMNEGGWVFAPVQSTNGKPTLAEAAVQLRVSVGDLDSTFDVQPFTPSALVKYIAGRLSVSEVDLAARLLPADFDEDTLYCVKARAGSLPPGAPQFSDLPSVSFVPAKPSSDSSESPALPASKIDDRNKG